MDRINQPQNERSRRTRAAILDATWKLIEECGAERLSMTDVARRAGVSRRAIYLHFASHGELLLALMGHVDEVLDVAASLRPVAEAQDAVGALDEWAAHLARYHPQILRIGHAVDRARRSDPDVATLYEHAMDVWYEGCRGLAERLSAEGRLAEPWTIESAADWLWALMSLDLLEDLTVDRGWSHDRYRDMLATAMRRTLVQPNCGGA